jgi:alpha-ribazole phosphatase
MALILLRHTTPRVSPGTCYGRTDLDVADSFEAEAETALAALPRFDRIISSPLVRCHKLAGFISEQAGLPVIREPRLQEMDFGAWEGMPWTAIKRSEIDAWVRDFLHARPHGGETVSELRIRARRALQAHHDPEVSTLFVTHAGVVRALLSTGDAAADFHAQIDFGGFLTMSDPRGEIDE